MATTLISPAPTVNHNQHDCHAYSLLVIKQVVDNDACILTGMAKRKMNLVVRRLTAAQLNDFFSGKKIDWLQISKIPVESLKPKRKSREK